MVAVPHGLVGGRRTAGFAQLNLTQQRLGGSKFGPRDLEAGNVSVRVHGKGNLGAKPRAEVVADLLASIKERRA